MVQQFISLLNSSEINLLIIQCKFCQAIQNNYRYVNVNVNRGFI